MIIKIIGVNTINGIKLKKTILKIANEIEGRVIINLIDNNTLSNLPILYVDDELVSEGIILSNKEIIRILKKHYKD